MRLFCIVNDLFCVNAGLTSSFKKKNLSLHGMPFFERQTSKITCTPIYPFHQIVTSISPEINWTVHRSTIALVSMEITYFASLRTSRYYEWNQSPHQKPFEKIEQTISGPKGLSPRVNKGLHHVRWQTNYLTSPFCRSKSVLVEHQIMINCKNKPVTLLRPWIELWNRSTLIKCSSVFADLII